MTGLLLRALGLYVTGTVWQDAYIATPEYLKERLVDEYQRNYFNEQKEIIVEDYFLFMEKIGKINYARGCAGEYSLPVRDPVEQRYKRCGSKSYDCAGLLKGYGVAKGIIDQSQLKFYNSQTIVELGEQKDAFIAQRGDWTSWIGPDGGHFAIVSRNYDGGSTLWIHDNNKDGRLLERPIRVRYSQGKFIMNHYVITVYTNGYVEEAMRKNQHIESWKEIEQIKPIDQLDPEEELNKTLSNVVNDIETGVVNEDNPLGYHIIVTGFAYDSVVNRTANRWYVRNNSKDMIATYLCENRLFNPDAKSQTRDSGICQLNDHRGNHYWLHDPRWNSNDPVVKFNFQRQACLDKWNLVQDHSKMWACYNKRQKFLDMIIDVEGGTWGIDDE